MKKKIISLLLVVCMIGSIFSSYTSLQNVQAEEETERPDFSAYDVMTLADNGLADTSYTAADFTSPNSNCRYGSPTSRKSLNGVLYEFYINTAGKVNFYLAGNASNAWIGLVFSFRDGSVYLTRNGINGRGDTLSTTFTTDKSRYNDEMHVQITFDYLAADTDSTINDVKVRVWIDDTFVGEHIYYDLVNLHSTLGSNAFFQAEDRKALTIRSLSLEELQSYYKTVTLADFGISSGTYTKDINNKMLLTTNEDKYLDGAVLSTHLKMTGDAEIRYGGNNVNGDTGVRLYTWNSQPRLAYIGNNGAELPSSSYTKPSFSTGDTVTTLLSAGCDVKIFTKIVDADGDGNRNDIKLGLGLTNGITTYYRSYVAKDSSAHFGGNQLKLCYFKNNGTIVVTEETEEQLTPEELGYKKVTFEDCNVQAGSYTEAMGKPQYGYYTKNNTLDGTYLDVDIVQTEFGGTCINYAGNNPLGWLGIRLSKTDTAIKVMATSRAQNKYAWEYRYESLGITDHTQAINIKLGVKVVDNDVIGDLWINGVRQNQMIFLGATAEFGNYASVYCDGADITVGTAVSQVKPEDLGFTMVEMDKDFQIPDFTYGCETSGKELLIEGTYSEKSLNNTCLNTDVKFGGEYTGSFTYTDKDGNEKTGYASGAGFKYAGLANSWTGINVHVADGNLYLYNIMKSSNSATITATQAGVDFSEMFNLKLGTKIYDIDGDEVDDIELYVWINDVYMGKYYFTNMTTKDAEGNVQSVIGNVARVYVLKEGQSVQFATPGKVAAPEAVLGEDFTKSTFASFQIADDTYSYESKGKDLVSGSYPFSMNKMAFTGQVSYENTETAQIQIGGKQSAWHGIKFWAKKGNLYMQDTTGLTKKYQFLSAVAGIDFSNDTFNLQVSFEYVDCDNDGAKDDISVGVWFNGKLYNNDYIELVDYRQHLGKSMGIYTPKNTKEAITVASEPGVYNGVDFKVWGFTDNWEKEIGVK